MSLLDELVEIEWKYGHALTERDIESFTLFLGRPPKLEENRALTWADRFDNEHTLREVMAVGFPFELTKRLGLVRLPPETGPVEAALTNTQLPPLNQKCNVVVAGTKVLDVKEVYLMEDCCTDELNRALLNGDRILAVCVQPDQRRPDYIMAKGLGG